MIIRKYVISGEDGERWKGLKVPVTDLRRVKLLEGELSSAARLAGLGLCGQQWQ